MQEPTVISLGGSLIIPDKIDNQFLKSFRDTILKFVTQGHHFIIVAGGGRTTRVYQEAARQVGTVSEEDVDWIGIHATRLNAHLLRTIFREKAHLKVLTHYNEKESLSEPLAIAAGWKPGHSTDYDTVAFAKLYGCHSVINLSDVPYVFDKDPDKFPDAVALEKINWVDFRKIVGDVWTPGDNLPFDPIASKAAQEAGLKVVIMDGHNLQNFENYLEGKEFEGTVIS
ncbi:MAG: UMP kinase [bacterium]|nr:UMP kinase [bacterium]